MGDLDSASSSVVELYLPKGLLAGESYAQTAAPHHTRLFGFYDPDQRRFFRARQCERVMLDAQSVPLLHSKYTKGPKLHKRVDVYRGKYDSGGSLVFTVTMKPSLHFKGLDLFLAGSALDGPPDYELKVPTFAWQSYKIFQQDKLLAKIKKEGHLHPHYKITFSSTMDQTMVVMFVAIFDDLRPED